MAGSTDPRPPLPDWILECYDCLRSRLCTPEGQDGPQTIERAEAIECLLAADELALESGDAEHALDRLLDRGYFYTVESEIRITVPDEQCSS